MNTDRCHLQRRRQRRQWITAVAVPLALLLAAPGARADDRSLLHATQQSPYVFIILDTSGSMHQEIACTAADVAAGFCAAECDPGDCLPRMMGDDPDSKIYVAKQSIYNIMQSHPNINFGFGHFDQQGLRVVFKYWWYSLASVQPNGFIALDSGLNYPEVGQQELFGQQAWNCTDGLGGVAGFTQRGCNSTYPSHLDNSWEWERARRYPKLGDTNTGAAYSYYIQENSKAPLPPIYKVTFTPVVGQVMGAPTMLVSIKVDKCTNAACSTVTNKGNKVMTFNLANQTVYWDPFVNLNGTNVPDAAGNGGAFYNGTLGTWEVQMNNFNDYDYTLDKNDAATTALDPWSTTNVGCTNNPTTNLCDVQEPIKADSLGRTPTDSFSSGNVIPLDWTTNQQTTIMQRMAPNLLNPANTVPDFGIADYFIDHPVAGDSALQLKNVAQRPLAPEGGTPTGHAMMSFGDLMNGSNWYNNGGNGTSIQGSWKAQVASPSWINTAAAAGGDPFFSCKSAYVLLITDGLASSDDQTWNLDRNVCPTYYDWIQPQGIATSNPPGFACCAAEALRTITYGSSNTVYPIRTYVIGLGLTTTTVGGYNNTLQCITDQGGTGNRHFFNGSYGSGKFKGYPPSDPPPAGFCCSSADFNAGKCTPLNPCDGPGPFLPQSKADIVNALQTVLNLISSQATAFASAAVPSIQSNVQNKEIITSFLPLNAPIWPGRVDAYTDPVPTKIVSVTLPDGTVTTATVPDPSKTCTSPTAQGCHLWNAGGGEAVGTSGGTDTVLNQGLVGYDTASTDPTKRRVYYAPLTPITPGELRLSFQMPAVTDTAHLYDLENGLGLCGAGYSFYPPSSTNCTENALPASTTCTNAPTPGTTNPCPSGQTATTAPYTTAQQAVTFTESIKSYNDPNTKQTIQYLLGDIFHSDPQVLGQPTNTTLFDGNVNNYQAFANAERFRRKVLYFGSDDGELHALDVGTVQLGIEAGQPAWTFGNGTGSEIFAFVPRTVMPTLNQLAIASASTGGAQTFMVDGPPHLTEGFFDGTGATNPCPQTSPPATCQWHSLVVDGLREGGHGYYALDVTQPDMLQNDFETPGNSATNPIQLPNPNAPNYLPNCLNGGSGCGQLPYPTPLWEFTDSCKVVPGCVTNCQLKPCDEDLSGPGLAKPDLGETWSRANSGRIRICDTGACTTFHDQWVVVFGGGMDPSNTNTQGNWLYMLDMANGKVLYKRQLNGSVPSEPAAIDTGQDGYLDTIYIGTTAGHLYKIDLTLPAPIDSVTNRVSTSFWQPFEIFDTEGRQMYYPPAVFLDTDLGMYGLAWGTGNRFDLWANTNSVDTISGRFYVMIDTGFTAANTKTPLKAANLQALTPDGALNPGKNFLLSPNPGMQPGYYFDLPGSGVANSPGERVLSEAFTLSGVVIFASYVPKPLTSVSNNNTVCADTGDTHVFLINVNNGDAISSQLASEGTGTPTGTSNRYLVLSKDLGLNISTTEVSPIISNKANPSPPSEGLPGGNLPAATKDVMAQIMKLMPSNCRFTNNRIAISVTDTNNSTYNLGAVPICIIEKNWKEF
jgi:hypothetical protein